MSKVEPRVLKGFRDHLPAKMVPRQQMLGAIERTFSRFGFLPLMTPALEYLEVLTGKYGEEGDSLLYRFKDHGDRDVGLRYDLTVPLARVVAMYPEITLPFRRWQIAPVWRAENPARGRFREFVQCDGDIVGSPDMNADAEVVQLACELLRALGVERFAVRINNRKVLSGLMRRIGVAEGAAEAGVLRTIDNLPKIGEDEAARLLREENGLGAEPVRQVFDFLAIRGEPLEVLGRAGSLFEDGSIGQKGVSELKEVFEISAAVGLGGELELDFSIARGLNYYTGTIYEAFLGSLPGYGAVMGGGRYDGLIGVFKGQEIPGVGISLGIDRLLEGLVELKLLEERARVARVLVTVFGPATAAYSARAAQALRAGGIACELFPAYAKVGKQFRHAERAGQRWVVVCGADEQAKGAVAVKDLETGKQEEVALDALLAYLAERVGP
ncbi:MAG: histidine--tRNA ligase [Planctomycetes bacterium]|nr:histidine--tRNA ligase [Planctomycetota bacterium]